MSKSLIVGGKEYFPSADIAKLFDYSPDYVSRLAREKKITAAYLNGRWFVEQGSMREFNMLAEGEKRVRAETLKKQRKVEQLPYAQKIKQIQGRRIVHTQVALAQATAVLMCGAFVGLLGWTVSSNNIDTITFAQGVEKTYIHIVDVVAPDIHPGAYLSNWSILATVQESMSRKNDAVVDVPTQRFTGFSDEVDVIFENEHDTVVQPIFRNGERGDSYRVSRESTQ